MRPLFGHRICHRIVVCIENRKTNSYQNISTNYKQTNYLFVFSIVLTEIFRYIWLKLNVLHKYRNKLNSIKSFCLYFIYFCCVRKTTISLSFILFLLMKS